MVHIAAYTIIKSLNQQQKDLIISNLTTNKSSTLLKLFKTLDSLQIKNLSAETLTNNLYENKLEGKKQLEDDLQSLKEILEDELIKWAIDLELKNNSSYKSKMKMFAYRQFDLNQLFEEEYEGAIETAKQQLAFDDVVTIQQWALNIAYQQKLPSLVSYNEKAEFFKSMSEDCSASLSDYTVSILRSNQFFESFSYHYHHQLLGKSAAPFPLIYAPTIVLKDNTLSQYHYYRTLAIYNEGAESIHYFLEAYRIINNFPYKNEFTTELILNTLLNIGRSYQQVGDYDLALSYLTQAVYKYLPSLPYYSSAEKLYANYILALLNAYDYVKALKMTEEVLSKFPSNNYIHNWFNVYKLMCFTGLKDIDHISINLPDNFNDVPPQHVLYYKVLNCFRLYLLNKKEEAINELEKLRKEKLFQDIDPITKRIIVFFQNSFTFLNKIASTENTKKSESLQNQVEEIESESLKDANIIPLFRWLKKELINGKAI